MKYLFLIAFFSLALVRVHAQNKEQDEKNIVYDAVDENPEPPGGIEGYNKYLSTHIQYPDSAKERGRQGKVYISFIVEKDGHLSNIKIHKDLVGYGCGEEALRVIKSMPPWTPGKINGRPIRVKYVIPVTFVLK